MDEEDPPDRNPPGTPGVFFLAPAGSGPLRRGRVLSDRFLNHSPPGKITPNGAVPRAAERRAGTGHHLFLCTNPQERRDADETFIPAAKCEKMIAIHCENSCFDPFGESLRRETRQKKIRKAKTV
ncbi:MAG: hypothetical protein ACOX8R_10590 [Bacillota bacterium]